MTEDAARKHLMRMLKRFTPGSVLHLLSDIYRTTAEEARQDNDARKHGRCKSVEQTLFVVGLGIDASCPS
jgi:hypothetical protein